MNPFNENKAVGQLSELLALERGYSSEKARQIRTAAALHDIGKQKTPQSILNKPSRLTVQEFEIVKKHTKIGAATLALCPVYATFERGRRQRRIRQYRNMKSIL